MRKYLTEAIGTFFLMLVISLTGNPLAIGTVLMVMVFAGGHISGAHYNPAITLAVLIRKKINAVDAAAYIIMQLVGATLAVFLAKWYMNEMPPNTMDLEGKTIEALVAELVGTFGLAYVVLNVATSRGTTGNSFYGLAI